LTPEQTARAESNVCFADKDFVIHRRKLNYRLGEAEIHHPAVDDVVNYDLNSEVAELCPTEDLPWEVYESNAKVVSTEADFRIMMVLIMDVPVVAVGTETSTTKSYKGSR